MKGIVLQIFKAARKDSLFVGATFLIVLSTVFSIFIGSNAIVEKWEMKVVYTSSIGRIATMSGLMIFLAFFVKRLFENKEIDVILSRPISRVKIVFAMFFGFSFLVLLISFPLFIALAILGVGFKALFFWYSTLLMEGLMVLAFTLFFSLLIKSYVYSLGFSVLMYILSRSIGAFVAYIFASTATDIVSISETLLKFVSVFIPRLDMFAKSSWLIYFDFGARDLFLTLCQTSVFSGLVFFACVYDFKKKQF